MSINGLTNFNLGNIQSLATAKSGGSTSTGGAFDLGNTGGNNVGEGNLGIGQVASSDQNAANALNSVAGESSIQQQFQNQLALVNLQERIQSQSRTIEILTNILKARHDASLSAARNVKS